jgi:hypothetical protein
MQNWRYREVYIESWAPPRICLYLFILVKDIITEGIRGTPPEDMMFADDIFLCGVYEKKWK